MIKAAGAMMIVLACVLLGADKASALRRRARLLSALTSALELTRLEVTSRLTPLPDIAERLAREGPPEARGFFSDLCAALPELDRREFAELWRDCALRLELKEGELSALLDAGLSLGRYGAEEQAAALCRCMEALGAAAEEAGAEAVSGGRLWTGLGLTAGLLLAVALI